MTNIKEFHKIQFMTASPMQKKSCKRNKTSPKQKKLQQIFQDLSKKGLAKYFICVFFLNLLFTVNKPKMSK